MARSMQARREGSTREREKELVLAFQGGDPGAYNSIDRTCRPAAERICRKLLINPADVEEAVQETMVRAYQGLPRFNGSYALTAWVARIATNVCLDTLRARSRRPQTAGTIEPSMEVPSGHETNGGVEDPEELVVKVFEAEEVRHVLAELPERHRTALVLREFEGYSHARIAEMLDTSPQRVKALIHRAKAGFRRAWKDDGPGRLAAFAPLLTPVNWVRKLFGRAPEFDYTPAASAATAAASPAAQTFTVMASERISTAVAAVMLAGTVGFAVQNAPRPSKAEEPKPAVVEFVPAPEPAVVEKPAAVKRVRKEHTKPQPEPAAAVVPVVEPTPELAGDLPEEEKEEAEAEAAEPKPDLPPHPAGFVYSFSSDRTALQPCGCGGTPTPSQDGINVTKDGFGSYSGHISAFITDSSGQPAWPVNLNVSASTERLDLSFSIEDANGTSLYSANGLQAQVLQEAWGGWTFTYSGTYERRGGPVEHVDMPQKGSLSATLTYSWVQQRLVVGSFALSEAA